MQPIQINCPHCNHPLEYWTKNNYINCPNCKDRIAVEPCEEPLDHEIEDELLEGDDAIDEIEESKETP